MVKTYIDNNFAMTAEAVEPLITDKTKIMVIINPCNPTGAVTLYEEVLKLSQLAIKHDLIVISDEIYSRLTFWKSYSTTCCSLTRCLKEL